MDSLKKETFSQSLQKMDSKTLYDRHVAWSIRQKQLLDERVKLNEAIETIEQIKHAYVNELFKRDDHFNHNSDGSVNLNA